MKRQTRNWQPFALLMIDFQRDFWPDSLAAAFPELPQNTSELLSFSRSEQLEVIHLRAEFEPDQSDWMPRHRLSGSCPCVRGSGGEAVLPWATEMPDEKLIVKHVFDGFLTKELLAHLGMRKKRFLLFAGIETSVCVLTTALSAGQQGFGTALVGDCCADVPAKHQQVLTGYDFAFETIDGHAIGNSYDRWLEQLAQLPTLSRED